MIAADLNAISLCIFVPSPIRFKPFRSRIFFCFIFKASNKVDYKDLEDKDLENTGFSQPDQIHICPIKLKGLPMPLECSNSDHLILNRRKLLTKGGYELNTFKH